MIKDDTIVAISTPPGVGAISVIRVSGEKAFDIVKNILPENIDIYNLKSHTIKYTKIIDCITKEIIDDGLISIFKAPKSFTGENIVELSVHGGSITPYRVLNALIYSGARIAERGEFTKRAFLNNKIDLTQAEAIADLIKTNTITGARLALSNIFKRFSNEVDTIKNKLLDIIAHIEVCIDYPDENIEEIDRTTIVKDYEEIKSKINYIITSSRNGRRLSDGVIVVLIGKTNVGKSSLLNNLAKEERAIVSSIHGTTRDAIEVNIEIQRVPLTIVDTAGLRDAGDELEELGRKKTHKYLDEAHLILAIFDGSQKLDNNDIEIIQKIKNKDFIAIINKSDLKNAFDIEDLYKITGKECKTIKISSLEKKGLEDLEKELALWVRGHESGIEENAIIASIRAENLLIDALNNIENAIESLKKGESYEFVSLILREALNCLGKITGEITTEDVLNRIFDTFCVGK